VSAAALEGNETPAPGIEHNVSGLIVCVVVLAAAAVFGVVWRRRNGVLRVVRTDPRRSSQGQRAQSQPGVTPAPAESRPAAGVGAAGGNTVGRDTVAAAGKRPAALTAEQLGRPLGARATLVQFSTAFCAPCRATRRILADVAGTADGVVHVEVDAEANLGLVRSLGIHSTPTVLVLAADGTIVRRGTGQPRKPDVIVAIAAAGSPADTHEDAGGGSAPGQGRS